MTTTRKALWLVVAALGLGGLAACGGGGGGAPPANVSGQVVLISTGQPPSPAATVRIGGAQAQTDANGLFILRSVASDSKQITISAQGAASLTQALPTLTPNADNDLGTIYLADTTEGYTANVVGTVVRSDTQAPVAGATVTMNGLVATTNAQGKFEIDGLPVGLGGTVGAVYGTIKAPAAANLVDQPIYLDLFLGSSAPPSGQPNDLGILQMSPPVGPIPGGPTDIRGTIGLQGRTDLSGTTVTLVNKTTGQTVATQTTVSDGRYGFWVVAGQYTVKAEHPGDGTTPGFQPQQKDVALARPDQTVTVDMTLVP